MTPIAVLPVLFHLLWRHCLHTDLSAPLHPDAVITMAVTGCPLCQGHVRQDLDLKR